jgi:predicted  nucleic acid-binding Zn-ribbon protein
MTYANHGGGGHHDGGGDHSGDSSDGEHGAGHSKSIRPGSTGDQSYFTPGSGVHAEDATQSIDRSNRALTGLTSNVQSFKATTAKFYEVQSTGAAGADLPTIDPEAKSQLKTVLAHTTVVEKHATDLLTNINSLKSDVSAFQSLQRGKKNAALDGAFSTFQTDLQGIKNEVQSMIQSGEITDQEIEKAISEATQEFASIKENIINNHSTDATLTEQSTTDLEALGKSFDDLSTRIAASDTTDKAAQTKLKTSLDSVKQQMNALQTTVTKLSGQVGPSASGDVDASQTLAKYGQGFEEAAKNVRLAAQALDQSMTDMQNSVTELQKLSPSDDADSLQSMAADIQDLHESSDKELKTLADAFDALARDFN